MRMQRLGIIAAALLVALAPTLAPAQVRTIDPNQAIDSDLPRSRTTPAAPRSVPQPTRTATPYQYERVPTERDTQAETVPATVPAYNGPAQERRADATTDASETYKRDDLIGAGEGVFGKGAEGLAGIIEKILKDQGEPNAYIAGREASGAFVVGLRYGSGVMTHKVEGQMPVYWTGPSVGFDVGGDANKVFVLVYNLYDTADIYRRFPAAEGRLYFVGGFAATYLRRGHIVLIPIRLGVGWRAGVNVGYMKFTHHSRWLPF